MALRLRVRSTPCTRLGQREPRRRLRPLCSGVTKILACDSLRCLCRKEQVGGHRFRQERGNRIGRAQATIRGCRARQTERRHTHLTNPTSISDGHLLLIGGAERRDAASPILSHLVELAGGNAARILVCASATRFPESTLAAYGEAFAGLGAADVWLEPLQERQACEAPTALERLDRATAVFFTGGDQYRLATTLSGTTFAEHLRDRLARRDLILSGSSAGAAAMSATMIVRGQSGGRVRRADVDLGVGLGYMRDAIIDTHFNQRGRIHRLLTVFAQYPQILGIGVDEDTAADVRIGRDLRVFGSGAVTLFDGRHGYSNAADAHEDEILAVSGVIMHALPAGWTFDLRSREVSFSGAGGDAQQESG